MQRLVVCASIMAFSLNCSQPKPTNFKPSMQEGVMTDAKSTVPAKAQVTYPNGTILLERKDGSIKILDMDGSVIAEGKIQERKKDGSILFRENNGALNYITQKGVVGLGIMETQDTLHPAPNIH